jgi:hypothetical protein
MTRKEKVRKRKEKEEESHRVRLRVVHKVPSKMITSRSLSERREKKNKIKEK